MTRARERGTPCAEWTRAGLRRRIARLGALLSVAAVVACGAAPFSPKTLSERPSARSVPELLSMLPEELRARYVLMRRSRSPEPASAEAPRAVLYSADAKLIVAFGGAGDAVDVMRFDDATTSFVFREIRFSDAQGLPTVRVSEPNPERCRACHGTPARPVWDTYPLWPGTFDETEEPSPAERSAHAAFDAARASHPRYRYLEPRRAPVDPAAARYRGVLASSSNAELTALLGALNAKAVAAELRSAPGFERHRYELLEALIPACGQEAVSRGRARDPAFASFVAQAREANADQEACKRARARERPRPRPPADDRAMTRLRFVAERELHVSTASWTLALEKGSFDFTTSRGAASGFEARLLAELGRGDERLASLYWQGGDMGSLCAYVDERIAAWRRRSIDPWTTSAPPALATPARSPETLLERCASCHEQGVGPPIPFGDPAALARRLSLPGSPRPLLEEIRRRLDPAAGDARMPLNLSLSPGAGAEFMDSLLALETRPHGR
jgi:hypothetical protein